MGSRTLNCLFAKLFPNTYNKSWTGLRHRPISIYLLLLSCTRITFKDIEIEPVAFRYISGEPNKSTYWYWLRNKKNSYGNLLQALASDKLWRGLLKKTIIASIHISCADNFSVEGSDRSQPFRSLIDFVQKWIEWNRSDSFQWQRIIWYDYFYLWIYAFSLCVSLLTVRYGSNIHRFGAFINEAIA